MPSWMCPSASGAGWVMMVRDHSQVLSAPSVEGSGHNLYRPPNARTGWSGSCRNEGSFLPPTVCDADAVPGRARRKVREFAACDGKCVAQFGEFPPALLPLKCELGGQRPDHAPDALHQRVVSVCRQEPLVGEKQAPGQAGVALVAGLDRRQGAPPVRQNAVGAGAQRHQLLQLVVRHIGLSAAIFR